MALSFWIPSMLPLIIDAGTATEPDPEMVSFPAPTGDMPWMWIDFPPFWMMKFSSMGNENR
ncbi:hypothetical protein DK27_18815 [Xanthomonas arboricola pv. pruni]|nr:hypothetical protein DK27_18815 [Xanthomonas arboricola pv. pruni]